MIDRTHARSALEMLALTKKLAFTALLGFYGFWICELSVRLIKPQPLLPRYTTATSYGIRGHVPYAHYRHVTGDAVTQYRINGQGMRADKEYSIQPAPGTCRIGFFGASYLMGYEVEIKDMMSSYVERQINALGYNIEVLNFALAGFSTAEMLRTYEGLGKQFSLGIVVFEWAPDDFDDNVRSGLLDYKDGAVTLSERTYLPAVKVQDILFKFRVYRWLAENSHFYSFFRELASAHIKALLVSYRNSVVSMHAYLMRSAATKATAPTVEVVDPVKLSAGILQYSKNVVTNDGSRFIVIDIPSFESRVKFSSTLDAFSREDLKGLDIVRLLETFRSISGPNVVLYREKGHFHFSPLGNEIAARALSAEVLRSGQLESCHTGMPSR
jgi:hypothetical protein